MKECCKSQGRYESEIWSRCATLEPRPPHPSLFATTMSSYGQTLYHAFCVVSVYVLKLVNEQVNEPYMVRAASPCWCTPLMRGISG
jgi:hypothetical protein